MNTLTGIAAIASGFAAAATDTLGVTIGTVTLSGWELPEKMPFGGAQTTVVHKFPGGGRVVDALGRDDRDVAWSGYLRTDDNSDAMSRAMMLDAIRVAGNAVSLTWGSYSATVVVSQFLCDYAMQGALLPYSMTCVVVSAGSAAAAAPSTQSAVSSDLSSAAGQTDLSAGSAGSIASAQADIPIGQTLAPGSAGFSALATQTSAAASSLASDQASAEAVMAGLSRNATGASTTFASLGDLAAASSATSGLASAALASGYVGRAVRNLSA